MKVAMQLRLNFDQRMVYDQTNKSVNAGDVVHLQNRPYYIDEVMLQERRKGLLLILRRMARIVLLPFSIVTT